MSDAPKIGYKPYGLTVLVRKSARPEQRTAAGLVIPDAPTVAGDSSRHDQGTVVAIGTGERRFYPDGTEYRYYPDVTVGDYIYYRTGEEIQIGAYTYYSVHDNAIAGVWNEKPQDVEAVTADEEDAEVTEWLEERTI